MCRPSRRRHRVREGRACAAHAGLLFIFLASETAVPFFFFISASIYGVLPCRFCPRPPLFAILSEAGAARANTRANMRALVYYIVGRPRIAVANCAGSYDCGRDTSHWHDGEQGWTLHDIQDSSCLTLSYNSRIRLSSSNHAPHTPLAHLRTRDCEY